MLKIKIISKRLRSLTVEETYIKKDKLFMRKILVINIILFSILSCTDKDKDNKAVKENTSKLVITDKTTVKDSETFQKFEESTYDRTDAKDRIENHQSALASLSENGIFKSISDPLLKELSTKHEQYFSGHPEYELLSVAKGSLTSEGKNDRVFVVFNKSESMITIFIYQAEKDLYRELYRTVNVENGLEGAGCNYGTFGTLDYQIGTEIIYHQEFLEKNVGQFFEAVPIIMNGLKEDENFTPDHGCFSKGMSIAKKVCFIAIPTSQVYNNWECLNYQSASDSFLIFYGQAFAD